MEKPNALRMKKPLCTSWNFCTRGPDLDPISSANTRPVVESASVRASTTVVVRFMRHLV
jgi:hypothetical protein